MARGRYNLWPAHLGKLLRHIYTYLLFSWCLLANVYCPLPVAPCSYVALEVLEDWLAWGWGRRKASGNSVLIFLAYLFLVYVLWLLFPILNHFFMKEEITVFSCVIIFINNDLEDLWLQLRHTFPSPQICLWLYCKLNTTETTSKWGFCCWKEWKWDLAQSNCCAFFHNEWAL